MARLRYLLHPQRVARAHLFYGSPGSVFFNIGAPNSENAATPTYFCPFACFVLFFTLMCTVTFWTQYRDPGAFRSRPPFDFGPGKGSWRNGLRPGRIYPAFIQQLIRGGHAYVQSGAFFLREPGFGNPGLYISARQLPVGCSGACPLAIRYARRKSVYFFNLPAVNFFCLWNGTGNYLPDWRPGRAANAYPLC